MTVEGKIMDREKKGKGAAAPERERTLAAPALTGKGGGWAKHSGVISVVRSVIRENHYGI